jgi:hypothetical protein
MRDDRQDPFGALGGVVLAAVGGGVDAREPIEKGYQLGELHLVERTAQELADLPDVRLRGRP